jgi:asparagine synthetase B (glutamine-hydrolysing)
MCGIFGLVAAERSNFGKGEVRRIISQLMRLSEVRGKEAAGLAIRTDQAVEVYKSAGRASKMDRSPEFDQFFSKALDGIAHNAEGQFVEPVVAFGHSRMVTNGFRSLNDNNQPILTTHSIGVHNGIIVNEEALWQKHPELKHTSNVDSEVIFRLVDYWFERLNSLQSAISKTFSQIEGMANVIMVRNDAESLELATNNGSLYVAQNEAEKCILFASERHLLARAMGRLKLGNGNVPSIRHVKAGQGVSINYRTAQVTWYDLERPEPVTVRSEKPNIPIRWKQPSMSGLRRCSRCILPGTFPGISFDDAGVCSMCRTHEVRAVHGPGMLEKVVAPHRSKDGSPDCVVAFSGGRDSSYGLHYLKRELGMNPVAYTYDWGMVTDLARRNISRLCAKLGVEHILRSPDIPAKRRNIRKNIEAWTHRPDLGMIPLFMAGDKQFYHYGRTVRNETGAKLVFFCAGNELERTEFKTGFCGIQESKHGQVLWKYSIRNKFDLASYYMKQFLLNPRYLNSSIFDTIWAFYSTYVERDDFEYFYHYIQWNENLIINTLKSEYDWEEAGDSVNTWRIGDGTAAFYNYIYHTVAGFSEHDTFRSNQVRVGIITREEALRLAEEDNQPRWESMNEYAQTVGFNLEEVLVVINNMPRLYH